MYNFHPREFLKKIQIMKFEEAAQVLKTSKVGSLVLYGLTLKRPNNVFGQH